MARPDYVRVTEEDPAPSSLYVKFVQDMARDVCDQIVEVDLQRDPGDTPTLWPHAPVDGSATDDQLDENVRYMVMRWLGISAEPDSTLVEALVKLHGDTVAAIPNPDLSDVPVDAEGWRSVCIALFEDPAFHLH